MLYIHLTRALRRAVLPRCLSARCCRMRTIAHRLRCGRKNALHGLRVTGPTEFKSYNRFDAYASNCFTTVTRKANSNL